MKDFGGLIHRGFYSGALRQLRKWVLLHVIVTGLMLSGSVALFAQGSGTVTGVVSDISGEPLPGVTVVIMGTDKGVISDNNGFYSMPGVPHDALLSFSFIGMDSQEVAVDGRSTINVFLQSSVIGLDEVVAIGYGTQRKRDLTGAVASVGEERLADIPATNLTGALQGAVSGVSISTAFGTPGGGSSVLDP